MFIDGRNCETCIEGFYRPAGIHASDTSPCQSCDCSIDGSVGVDCVKVQLLLLILFFNQTNYCSMKEFLAKLLVIVHVKKMYKEELVINVNLDFLILQHTIWMVVNHAIVMLMVRYYLLNF